MDYLAFAVAWPWLLRPLRAVVWSLLLRARRPSSWVLPPALLGPGPRNSHQPVYVRRQLRAAGPLGGSDRWDQWRLWIGLQWSVRLARPRLRVQYRSA